MRTLQVSTKFGQVCFNVITNSGAIDASRTLHPVRTRGSVREKDDTRKAIEDKGKNEELLEKELRNFKAFSYSVA